MWLKNNWKSIAWILIAIAALILLFVLFWPSKVATSHDQEKKTIDSLMIVVKQLKGETTEKVRIDSIGIDQAKRKIDSLGWANLAVRAQAKTLEARAKYYALLYENSKVDSGAAYAACDQIIQLVDSQSMVINTMRTISDSIQLEMGKELVLKDSVIMAVYSLQSKTDNALQAQNKAYQGLFSDYNKEVKHNKTNRTLTRILALTTLILGGILLAK